MPSTNKCNLEDDEKLAAQVEKYPCLYDKSRDDYKDRGVKETAWQVIDYELGFSQGEAEKKFEILKKRFSRKRIDAKRARMSGPSHYDVSTAKKAYEEYDFLSWYEPYIRDKKTSLDVATYDDGVMFSRHMGEYDDDDQIEDKLHLPEDSVEVHEDEQYENMNYDAPSFVRKHWVKREGEERGTSGAYQLVRPEMSREGGQYVAAQYSRDDHGSNSNINGNSITEIDNNSSNSHPNSNESKWSDISVVYSNGPNGDNKPVTSEASDGHAIIPPRPIPVHVSHKTEAFQNQGSPFRPQSSEKNLRERVTQEAHPDSQALNNETSSTSGNDVSGSVPAAARPRSLNHTSQSPLRNVQPQMSPDEAFGQMISSELSTFDDDLKFLVKNDLNKVIFEYRLKQQQMRRQNNS